MPVRTLLLDNYDSYTFNLYQLLGQINGGNPHTLHLDDLLCQRTLLNAAAAVPACETWVQKCTHAVQPLQKC